MPPADWVRALRRRIVRGISLAGRVVRGRPASLGEQGEQAAARYLRKQGYAILERAGPGRLGELDLVAATPLARRTSAPRIICFVEVKTRRSDASGAPAEAVDEEKQRRITRAALAWLKRHRLLGRPARFDVIAVTWPEGARQPRIEHFPAAFDAQGRSGFFS